VSSFVVVYYKFPFSEFCGVMVPFKLSQSFEKFNVYFTVYFVTESFISVEEKIMNKYCIWLK